MNLKNIYVNDNKWINVNTVRLDFEEVKEFPDEFKKTMEFKRLKRLGFIEVVKVEKKKTEVTNESNTNTDIVKE